MMSHRRLIDFPTCPHFKGMLQVIKTFLIRGVSG